MVQKILVLVFTAFLATSCAHTDKKHDHNHQKVHRDDVKCDNPTSCAIPEHFKKAEKECQVCLGKEKDKSKCLKKCEHGKKLKDCSVCKAKHKHGQCGDPQHKDCPVCMGLELDKTKCKYHTDGRNCTDHSHKDCAVCMGLEGDKSKCKYHNKSKVRSHDHSHDHHKGGKCTDPSHKDCPVCTGKEKDKSKCKHHKH